MTFRT
ncbi:hypothetical protein D033_1357A, partial [Vibrio parahaemolyticus B-265]